MGPAYDEMGPARASGGVRFRYYDPRASRAFVAGDFNGWRASACEMRKDPRGMWEAVVPLERGVYQYKFVVDGAWVRDPRNPCVILNGHGTFNSVIEVTPDGDVRVTVPPEGAEGLGRLRAVVSPEWAQDAIIYEVFPRVFSEDGSLRGVARRVPELADLGVTCIWLMPVHDIGRRERKGTLGSPYAIYDYYGIHPDLGTREDLRALVNVAHDHGLRVILDFVANHSAVDCPLTVVHPEWYRRDARGNIARAGFGWDDVVAFDYADRNLRAYMIGVMRHYVEAFDIDGYRCDVAALVPVDFWQEARRALQAIKPDILMLAESHEPLHNATAFDVTYEEALPGILADVLGGRSPAEAIRLRLEDDRRTFPAGSLRLRYLENHDQQRAMRALGRRGYEAAAALLFTLDGVPLIYNGQEIGEVERPSLFEPSKIRWCSGDPVIRSLYRDLCRIRRETPALRRGSLEFVDCCAKERLLAFVRRYESSQVLVVLNFSADVVEASLDLPEGFVSMPCAGGGVTLVDVAGRVSPVRVESVRDDGVRIRLEPYGVRIFRVA